MANLRNIFSRYRRVMFFVFLILVCLTTWWYIRKLCMQGPCEFAKIYETEWGDMTGRDGIVYRKCTYFWEPSFYLPVIVEKYSKRDPNDIYRLDRIEMIGNASNGRFIEVPIYSASGALP